jgi:hypothetical protein
MATYSVSIDHADTCLPSYVQDHHTRDGECLLGVALSHGTTYKDVLDGIKDEWAGMDVQPADEENIDDLESAFAVELASITAKVTDLSAIFDSSIEESSDDDTSSESCYAWFVVTWSREEEEEE